MSSPARYRFLPWTRRGLVAELRDGTRAVNGALPFRGSVQLQVTLTGTGGVQPAPSPDVAIAGPGDVMGIDTTSIVRLTPRRDASDVEPNYLVAIDFDDPDFPWMLTPSAPDAGGRLRPWLVLVVVEDRDGVSVSVPPGAPLPQLRIESGAQRELQHLDDSWAWAHTQVLTDPGSGATAAPEVLSDPDRHVSRLLCPRRLRPDTRWLACLVPAFDAGRVRGMGGTPPVKDLQPAWTDEDAVTLPVYFHWQFGTGAAGDFESLARRLQPFVVESVNGTPSVGTVRMHIGDAGGPVDLVPDHPSRIVQMDGALRALAQDDGEIDEITTDFREPLGDLLDAIADPGLADPKFGAVGPPLYGSWAANRFHVAGAADPGHGWFAEVNLDPRARVAAGLGAEVVRREQENLMTACWQQVGAVLQANALLSRARLSIDASTLLHAKTIARMTPEAVIRFAGTLTDRTLMAAGDVTVRAAIGVTSLPDAAVDPAMRRLVSSTNRFVRKSAAVRSVDADLVATTFLRTLAAGTPAVDPTAFVPAGVRPPADRSPVEVGRTRVDLTPIGLPVVLPKAEVEQILAGISTVTGVVVPPPAERLRLRSDLRRTGLVTQRHVDAIRRLPTVADDVQAAEPDAVIGLVHAATSFRDTDGFVLGHGIADGTLGFEALDITHDGTVVMRTPATHPNIVVGVLQPGTNPLLPIDLVRPGEAQLVLRNGARRGDVVVDHTVRADVPVVVAVDRAAVDRGVANAGNAVFVGDTVTLPPLVRSTAVIARFESAVALLPEFSAISDPVPVSRVVPFALATASTALVERSAPATAHTRRVESMVRFGGASLDRIRADATISGISVAPAFDRIMAYPELNDPAYRMLARYDRDRLLPGVDSIPPDTVTLLETNPRFVAGFLAGLNHELNRELLWRRYPTDQRGTPMRRFWDRSGGGTDVAPMHRWTPLTSTLTQVAGGESNLVLLIRGELLRRYPNTVVLAVRSIGPNTPSTADADIRRPIFSGFLEPDITFFGFDLVDDDIRVGDGWFFALQEQITEPRFGMDQTVVSPVPAQLDWRNTAWPNLDVAEGATFDVAALRRQNAAQPQPAPALSPLPPATNSAIIADAMFQNPVQVMVHGRNLTAKETS